MMRNGQHILVITAFLVMTRSVITQELPDGFTRRGDVIFPLQREMTIETLRHPDSSALQTRVKQLQGQAGGIVSCF